MAVFLEARLPSRPAVLVPLACILLNAVFFINLADAESAWRAGLLIVACGSLLLPFLRFLVHRFSRTRLLPAG